ncbi:hypothetical protein PBCVCVR1_694L [Paramecium bursaria Chlorella virus CVR-1]|uniref:Uncharacterized protein n=1 Tax=Paramecium bursaria Chlorella virus CVA-1 TaxID=42683 RepID=M1HW59_9PHYC|nr:hypothetical protein F8205_gp240 [Paramecium bursaria Chlorella virus CVA-1]AGE50585.1 hypothetical protein PBCVCVA1_686L [Paramecium bursaria Chlorella virus CVA-1]AGE52264.1 hypothetical protein PBCVCVR1_694L [Paramecium bursaria Chlorella virus CVR-1]
MRNFNITHLIMKVKKSLEARVKEMVEIRKKFDELGLDLENEQMQVLIAKMNDFVRGFGFSGKVDLSDIGRTAICKFTLQPHSVSTIILRAI